MQLDHGAGQAEHRPEVRQQRHVAVPGVAGAERAADRETAAEMPGNGTGLFRYLFLPRRVVVFRLLNRALQLHDTHIGGIAWLEAAANAFSEVLIVEEYLSRAEQDIFAMSIEEMKADMRNRRVDLENLT